MTSDIFLSNTVHTGSFPYWSKLTDWLDGLASDPQGSNVSTSSALELQKHMAIPNTSLCSLGDQTQVAILERHILDSLGYIPSPR